MDEHERCDSQREWEWHDKQPETRVHPRGDVGIVQPRDPQPQSRRERSGDNEAGAEVQSKEKEVGMASGWELSKEAAGRLLIAIEPSAPSSNVSSRPAVMVTIAGKAQSRARVPQHRASTKRPITVNGAVRSRDAASSRP